MTPGPEGAAAPGHGHLRATHTDRENAVVVLKAAFVQGQLTKDEFDLRVGQALASRTYSDLASLTTDIAVTPTLVEAPGQPARTLAKAARRAGICMLAAVALAEGAFLANVFGLLVLAFFAVMAASGFLGYGLLDSWQQRRTGGQLPSRPGRRYQRLEGGRGSRTGHQLAPPQGRADQTRADLRAHRSSGQAGSHSARSGIRARPGIRPMPGTA
jgi:Domain of unknown function (DUF1707)